MKQKKNTSKLSFIFNEIENVNLSDAEMDQELKGIGINVDDLVSEGMARVNKLTVVHSIPPLNHMPIAAGGPSDGTNKVSKSLKKRPKGGKRPKSK